MVVAFGGPMKDKTILPFLSYIHFFIFHFFHGNDFFSILNTNIYAKNTKYLVNSGVSFKITEYFNY